MIMKRGKPLFWPEWNAEWFWELSPPFPKSRFDTMRNGMRWSGDILRWNHVRRWASWRSFSFSFLAPNFPCLFISQYDWQKKKSWQNHVRFKTKPYAIIIICRHTRFPKKPRGSGYSSFGLFFLPKTHFFPPFPDWDHVTWVPGNPRGEGGRR